VKKGKKVVLQYTQVKWILLVRAVVVRFFQLLGPQQASQFFMEKFHVENFEAAIATRSSVAAK
jgi:hypothetical protein